MSDDYRQAARRLVSDLGRDRARQLLDLLEQDGSTLRAAMWPPDEERLVSTLRTLELVIDALNQVTWDEMSYEDLDDEDRSVMLRQLAEAMRFELDAANQ